LIYVDDFIRFRLSQLFDIYVIEYDLIIDFFSRKRLILIKLQLFY